MPRTNQDRTAATRRALLQAARKRFVTQGYAAASTPQIVADAGITRGALYHHFADKEALFRAVVAEEAEAVASAIEAAAPATLPPKDALLAGSDAYLEAMAVPGRTRILLREGPAVLGHAAMEALDESHAARTLREGLRAAMPSRAEVPLAPLATLLSAAFDRAAIAIDAGADRRTMARAIRFLILRVLGGGG